MGDGFDAVVIGAGVSGLTAACELARGGMRVVVLEQHSVPGGLMQRFRRRGIPFDTGFHYLGGAGEGGPLRPYLEHLGILDRIELEPFDPDGFDEVVLPGRRFAFPQGIDRTVASLVAAFPADAAGIRAYLAIVAAFVARHAEPIRSAEAPGTADATGAPPPAVHESEPLASVLDRLVRDADLKAVLAAHTLLYGVPAVRAPIAAHAVISGSYLHSAHGVRGGGDAFAAALVARLGELGGTLRLRCGVRRVVSDGRDVRGVETDAGEVVTAPLVVSTAHPSVTLGLLGDAAVPERHRRNVRALTDTAGALLVHAVVRGVAPAPLRRNRFWFASADAARDDLPPWFRAGDRPPQVTVLPASAAPQAAGDTVFQALCPIPPGDAPDAQEGAAWEAAKRGAATRAAAVAAACEPSWEGRIEVVNVSTPRATERYVRSPGGSSYGTACTAGQWRTPKFAPTFGLRGFVVAGQSVTLPGVYGCIATAVATARHALRGAP
ncbi:MAG: NAD(P)/FAD-dependent oxidoreductase [Planctomycetes bacterium]|nr:NAD(P)/FAD-dependent oxidoreductase [Planctomycetota bacterium]